MLLRRLILRVQGLARARLWEFYTIHVDGALQDVLRLVTSGKHYLSVDKSSWETDTKSGSQVRARGRAPAQLLRVPPVIPNVPLQSPASVHSHCMLTDFALIWYHNACVACSISVAGAAPRKLATARLTACTSSLSRR